MVHGVKGTVLLQQHLALNVSPNLVYYYFGLQLDFGAIMLKAFCQQELQKCCRTLGGSTTQSVTYIFFRIGKW